MRSSNRPNEDEEIEALRRSMRPDPRRTAAVLAAILVVSIGGMAYAIAHGFSEAEARWRGIDEKQKAPPASDSPFISTNRRLNAPHAVARQAVAIHTGRNPEPDGIFSEGSGFLMTDGMVITAAHVFTSIAGSERGPIYVRCDDVERKGTIAALDDIRDVAAIATPGCTGRTLSFSFVEPTVNDGLHAAGYNFVRGSSREQWFQFNTSIIPGVAPDPQREDIEPVLAQRLIAMKRLGIPQYFALAGELVPGNSGSAVFNDQGQVVGMLVATDSRFHRSYGVSSTVIVDVLQNHGLPLP